MTDTNEEEYPHWKTALFGNQNAVANLRCAIHYVFWHAVYGLMALVFGTILLGLKVIGAVVPVGRAKNVVHAVAENDTVKDVFRGIVLIAGAILCILTITIAIAALVIIMLEHFWTFVTVSVISIVAIAIFIGAIVLLEEYGNSIGRVLSRGASGARTAGEKATNTPGIRRVYGECPVSMDMSPKWFDDMFPEDDER